jgi:signal transduction histidine kinase
VRARPGRGAFGLRGRIVAALALLGPLEQSLRDAEQTTLRHDLRGSAKRFSQLPLSQFLSSPAAQQTVAARQQQLAVRVGAVVNVLYAPRVTGELLQPRQGVDTDDNFDDVGVALRTDRAHYSFGTIDNTEYARAALPFQSGGVRYVLSVRKPIDEIAGVVHVVRTAFLDAVLAGLALTLLLGIPLSGRLVRRLQALRQAALELADEGPAVQIPVDRVRDEVGDLSRTLTLMQQRLQQQEEARRSFVATASHELRTPLTSLDGMLELLHDDLRYAEPDLEDARALLQRARAQSRRLGRLAADLLDLSRIDAQVDLRSEPVELGELSRAVLAEFELGTQDRGISSQLDDLGGSVWALGDPGSIARILRILLDNAVRLGPVGSEIRIVLRRAPDVAISVCDQGPGVPDEERETIFRRFNRGRGTTGEAGFGLGLAIGRELAARMGGELVLERSDGSGATFTLKLPGAQAPEHDPVAVA